MTKSYYQKTEQKKNQNQIQTQYFDVFKGKPYWIPDKEKHKLEYERTNGQCCFWHILGAPKKDGVAKPVFDYEWEIFNALEQETKHIWIKKARGLGITEFMLRFIAWRCLFNANWNGKNVCIVTGPRIDLAITLIRRFKALFSDFVFDDKETVCTLNNVRIEAFPSHNLDAMRGLTNVALILLDEADFFPAGQQEDARFVAEGYIAKTNPYIVMVSTPNRPEGLYEAIQKLPDDQCIYKRMIMTYEIGLGKIYTESEIAKARESPSFPREYMGQFIGFAGNVFSEQSIQNAINNEMKMREQMHPSVREEQFITPSYSKSMGVDPAFGGGSKFGVTVVEHQPAQNGLDQMLRVVHAEEYDRPDFDDMINEIVRMKREWKIDNIFVDSSSPQVIRAIKSAIGERPDFDSQIDKLKLVHKHIRNEPLKYLPKWMSVIPVSFSSEGRTMLTRAKIMLDRRWLAIHPTLYNKLIISLRTAVATDDLLSKSETSHDDLLDSFRLALLKWDV